MSALRSSKTVLIEEVMTKEMFAIKHAKLRKMLMMRNHAESSVNSGLITLSLRQVINYMITLKTAIENALIQNFTKENAQTHMSTANPMAAMIQVIDAIKPV